MFPLVLIDAFLKLNFFDLISYTDVMILFYCGYLALLFGRLTK